MHFSKAVVKYRIPILIIAVLLMIPSMLGMIGTRINYDMLDYLPDDMDTVIGQNELLEDFGKGAFSLIIVEDMPDRDVAALCDKIKEVDHVETVIWYSTLADISVPKELLPDKIYDEFNTDDDGGFLLQCDLRRRNYGCDPRDPLDRGQAVLRFRNVGACHGSEGSL